MTTRRTLGKRIGWWLLGILGGLLLLAGIAALYINARWKPVLSEKLRAGVYEGSNHLYRLNFSDIHLNIFGGNIVIDSVTLLPDTAVYNRLKPLRKAPTHLFRIRLEHLKISRAGILSAYFKRKVTMNSIVFDQPSIDMIYHQVPRQRDTVANVETLYQRLSKTIRSLRINQIRIVDADFDYYVGEKKRNSVKHLTVNVRHVLIDSASQYDSSRVLYAKDIGFRLAGYESLTKDKMYNIRVDSLEGSLTRRTLNVKGLRLKPRYPDLAFSRRYNVQKDRYDLTFSDISASGVDFTGLSNNGDLWAKRIRIGPAKVAVFMNRELPPPGFDKARNFPHQALKRAPIPLRVDTLSLHHVDVAYTEFNPKTAERGTVKLDRLSGSILNVTNDEDRLAKRNHAYASLQTLVMGVAKLQVNIDFNLTSADAAFQYSGHVGPFNLQVLNPLARSLGLVEIKSGRVRGADFQIAANRYGSTGKVTFLYNDLKVNLLSEDEEGRKKKKGLLSFLANTVLIKNNNPDKGEAPRVADVKLERASSASFFNLMWKSIFLGMREAAGLGIVPMKKAPDKGGGKKKK